MIFCALFKIIIIATIYPHALCDDLICNGVAMMVIFVIQQRCELKEWNLFSFLFKKFFKSKRKFLMLLWVNVTQTTHWLIDWLTGGLYFLCSSFSVNFLRSNIHVLFKFNFISTSIFLVSFLNLLILNIFIHLARVQKFSFIQLT